MANTVAPILRPLCDAWNYFTHDQTLVDLQEFKGGAGNYNGWHNKYLRFERDQVNNQFLSLEKRFTEEPEVLDLAADNLLRLTVLSGFERVIAIRQAFSTLKQRFFLPVNTTGTLGEVLNQGFRQGYFRGSLLNATHFLGVHFNTLLWARGSDLFTQLFFSSAFEALFHPIDTVKTILYADTVGEYRGAMDVLGRVVQNQQWTHLYRGLMYKLIYNSAFLVHLRNHYEDNNWQYLTTPLWLFSYGFLAIKTRLQVSGTALSYQNALDLCAKGAEKGLYRGLVPFAALNYFFTYQLYGLYSQKAQDKQVEGLRATLRNNFSSPATEELWA